MFSSLLVFGWTYWVKVYGELRFSFYTQQLTVGLLISKTWRESLTNLLRGTVVGKLTDTKDKVLKKRVFVLFC